jgi:hypothetical protein
MAINKDRDSIEGTNKKICPICQSNNRCDVDNANGCWCMTIEVRTELIESLAVSDKDKRCICQACIEKFKLGKSV